MYIIPRVTKTYFYTTKTKNRFPSEFIQSKNGILKNVSGINDAEKIENVFKVHFNGVVGKKYDDVIDNSGRVGYVITTGDDAVTALNACNKAIDCIKVEYEDRCNNE